MPIKSSSNNAYALEGGSTEVVQPNIEKKPPKKKVKLNSSNAPKTDKTQEKAK